MLSSNRGFAKRVSLFLGIGILIYAALYVACEWSLYREAQVNRFFRVHTTAASTYDYVILGASHAMPLDFNGMNDRLQDATDLAITNLSMPGAGIVPNRLVLDYFLSRHQTRNVLYVIDPATLAFPSWNEERLNDASLFEWAPLDLTLARVLVSYAVQGKADWTVPLKYVTGFWKVNGLYQTKVDAWDLEEDFDVVYRASTSRYRERVRYVFPDLPDEATYQRYEQEFLEMVDMLLCKGVGVVVIETPVPTGFYELIPNVSEFEHRLQSALDAKEVPFYNFSLVSNDAEYFFDTDHLNRNGVVDFVDNHLSQVLVRHAR